MPRIYAVSAAIWGSCSFDGGIQPFAAWDPNDARLDHVKTIHDYRSPRVGVGLVAVPLSTHQREMWLPCSRWFSYDLFISNIDPGPP